MMGTKSEKTEKTEKDVLERKVTDNQRSVLVALTPARVLKTTRFTPKGEGRNKVVAVIETAKGKPVEGSAPLDVRSVEACIRAGWLVAVGEPDTASNDKGATVITKYTITDEGKKARKQK